MYVLVVTIDVKPDQKDSLLATLDDARGSVRNEPGCVRFDVIQDEHTENRMYLYEVYADRAAFDAHEASPHTRRYLAARDQYLASTEVDWLTLQAGKGTGG